MTERKLRVAAYCRVSTEKEDQANSLASQRSYFADFIKRHADWELEGVYYDEGISGTQTKNRTGFHAMMKEAERGGIDLILTKEVCRFARNTVDALTYTRLLKELGIGVVFAIDNIDTREMDGELRLTIMASMAQEESRKTSERVKWGQKRRMEQGVVFGRDLLGYKVSGGKLYINEEQADTVRAIFHKYANEGKGTQLIARELTEEGRMPMHAEKWSPSVILKLLKNEKYVGDLCQKKSFTPNYLTHAKKRNRGEEALVELTGHHEAIIDRALWDKTQRALKRRARTAKKQPRYSSRYWCSGRLVCALCKNMFVSRTKTRGDGTLYQAWRCSQAALHGRKKCVEAGEQTGCDNRSVNERVLLACMEYVLGRLPDDKKELLEEARREAAGTQGKTYTDLGEKDSTALREDAKMRLQGRIAALQKRRKKAVELWMEELITKEELRERLEAYEEEQEKLKKQLEAYDKERTERFLEYGKELEEVRPKEADSEKAPQDETKLFYKRILDKFIIYPDRSIELWLSGIPEGFRLHYTTQGRGEGYYASIDLMEVCLRKEASGEQHKRS